VFLVFPPLLTVPAYAVLWRYRARLLPALEVSPPDPLTGSVGEKSGIQALSRPFLTLPEQLQDAPLSTCTVRTECGSDFRSAPSFAGPVRASRGLSCGRNAWPT